MNYLKSSFIKRLFVVLLSLLLGLGARPLPALAQTSNVTASTSVWEQPSQLLKVSNMVLVKTPLFAFWPFGGRRRRANSSGRYGSQKQTNSAGRHGNCNALNQLFAAIVPRVQITNTPSQSATSDRALAFTAKVQPTVFVYLPDLSDIQNLPKSASGSPLAELMIQKVTNTEEVDFQRRIISVPSRGGIAPISFEQLGIVLEPAQSYRWYLSIICDRDRPARNPSVDAWIEVIDDSEREKIEADSILITDAQARVDFYTKEGLWPEAFEGLMQLRCQEPGNARYREELKNLLPELFLDDKVDKRVKGKIAEAFESEDCPILHNLAQELDSAPISY
ncbi:MAG: DUF928 domain-containing protein [Leptolyngbyaceae cyanobacterium]